ncbi:hypothetical protein PENTCL1PPCAC_20826, partial [Pristionchus entomophagus]
FLTYWSCRGREVGIKIFSRYFHGFEVPFAILVRFVSLIAEGYDSIGHIIRCVLFAIRSITQF